MSSPQCVDIEFRDPGDPAIPRVNETNCFNSTDLGFAEIYTITTKAIGESANSTTSGAPGLPAHRRRRPLDASMRLLRWISSRYLFGC